MMQFSDTGESLLDIIDRVGSVFKLQNGEFVCPARLEDVYMSCPSIQDIFVFGKPAWSGLVAVVRPTAGTDAGEAVREELAAGRLLCGGGLAWTPITKFFGTTGMLTAFQQCR